MIEGLSTPRQPFIAHLDLVAADDLARRVDKLGLGPTVLLTGIGGRGVDGRTIVDSVRFHNLTPAQEDVIRGALDARDNHLAQKPRSDTTAALDAFFQSLNPNA